MFNKQITINIITNILAMGITMLISLWATPYLIDKLGLAAYGYIGVINNIINIISLITFTLTSMLGRFMIVSIEQNRLQEANNYLSSAYYTSLFLNILLIPMFLIIILNVDSLIKIQSEYINDMKLAFGVSGIAFLFSSFSLIFSTGAYCKNRLEIKNGINIVSNIVRFSLLLILYSFFEAHIWFVAASLVFQVLVSIILGVISFKVLLPKVELNIKSFSFHKSLELLSTGFSISLIMFGTTLLTQIDLLVGNRYLPANDVGMYAAILVLPNSIRNVAFAISSAFTPTTISIYSIGDIYGLQKYSNKVVKYCGLMIGWPVCIVAGLAIPLLSLWLGKDYTSYEVIILLMLLPLTAHLAVNQLHNVHQAVNKVKIPAIASIIFGGISVGLAILFTGFLKMGFLGIALSGVLMSTIRTVVFMPIYTSIITNQPIFIYYKGILPPVIITLLTFTCSLMIHRYLIISSLISIVLSAMGLSIVYLVGSIMILDNDERIELTRKGLSLLRRQVV